MHETAAVDQAEIVVVGAGVVGAACALRLALAGHEVLLLDRDTPGMGASFGNAGHIAIEQVVPLANPQVIRAGWRYLVDADSPLRVRAAYLLPILPWLARFVWAARPAGLARGVAALMALQQTARDDLQQLMAQAGLEDMLHLDGYVRVWESEAGERDARAQAQQLGGYGVRTDALSAQSVQREAPGLNPGVLGGICYPDTGHIADPYALCAGLVAALLRAGGRVGQARVTRLAQERQGAVELGTDDGRRIRAGKVLLCAGAWSRPLAASLGYRVPLDTERGYHITLAWPDQAHAASNVGRMRRPIASTERHVIMTPMAMGLRMTGTLEFGGLDLPPDERRYTLLRRQMQALLPRVDAAPASTWMGFRPSLPDHLPVMGAAPRHGGVFFAFGHQHLGLTLCGVTARVMADLMQGRAPTIDLGPYHVDRFSRW